MTVDENIFNKIIAQLNPKIPPKIIHCDEMGFIPALQLSQHTQINKNTIHKSHYHLNSHIKIISKSTTLFQDKILTI